MKSLKELFEGLPFRWTAQDDKLVEGITADSRAVKPGYIFFAIPGTQQDGHAFIRDAISKGAKVIVCQHVPFNTSDALFIQVDDPAYYYGEVCARFFDHPSKKLKLVGVTGTNGKTSTVTFLQQLAEHVGFKAGLISTIHYYDGKNNVPATHTTPDAFTLQSLLAKMVDNGCQYAFMEVSSHAVVQKRIQGLHFAGGVFTNITHDHLDYHQTFKNYIEAKQNFFTQLPNEAFALYNADDRNGKIMVQNAKAQKYSYAIHSLADFKTEIMEMSMEGMLLSIQQKQVWVQSVGQFNAYNLTAVYATGVLLGFPENEILISLSKLRPPRGRFEVIRSQDGVYAIVDYAHTPDALENLLSTVRQIRIKGELWVIGGAGGNRDASKRPIMASVMSKWADRVILTSDNPRNEDPQSIIDQMYAGVPYEERKKVLQIVDRKTAIETACKLVKPGDVIVVAGKGHETYQEIQGVKHPFNDIKIIEESFNNRS